MLRLARIASVAAFLLITVLTWAQCIFMEETLPRGGTVSILLDISKTKRSKAQIVSDMRKLGETFGLEIVKSVPGTLGTDLISLGAEQPQESQVVKFMNPARNGTLKNSEALGDASLQGRLSVSNPSSAAIEAFREWGRNNNILVGIQETTPQQRIASVATRTGGWLALVGLAALIAGMILGWFASRAESREVRLLSGMRLSRIHADDLGPIAGSLGVPLLVLSAAIDVFVFSWRGEANWRMFSQIQIWYLVATLLLVVIVSISLSILTIPGVRDLADRKPPLVRFEVIAVLVKALSLGLVLAMLPGLVQSTSDAFAEASTRARWGAVAGGVAIRISAGSPDEFASLEPGLVELARTAASQGIEALCYDVPYPKAELSPFDSLIIVDRAYLRIMNVDAFRDLKPVSDGSLSVILRSDLMAQLDLWLSEGARSAATSSTRAWGLYTSETSSGFPSLGGNQNPYVIRQAPLIIVVDDLADLAPNVLSSAIAGQQMFFSDATALRVGIARTGVGSAVLSIDRVADLALTQSALSRLNAILGVVSLVLIVGGLIISVRLAADIHALNDVRRIVPLRLAGLGWEEILARRFGLEMILLAAVLGVTVLAREVAMPVASHESWQILAALAGAGLYVICWWLMSISSSSKVLHESLLRRV